MAKKKDRLALIVTSLDRIDHLDIEAIKLEGKIGQRRGLIHAEWQHILKLVEELQRAD